MAQPAEKLRCATYADIEALPPNKVGEIINGALHVMPRPAMPHTGAASDLHIVLGGPFRFGQGGPGGWHILHEPEVHFPNPMAKEGKDVVVPDLAGWRRTRMPQRPKTAYVTLAPDWICEVLSPSTESFDRDEKMPIYAREGVRDAWLVDPLARTLEAFALEGRRWEPRGTWRDSDRVRIPPFDAIEIDLSVLWTE